VSDIVLVSKSVWDPPTGREHPLARLARAHGHRVTFIERPLDIRALAGPRRGTWARSLTWRPGARPAPRPQRDPRSESHAAIAVVARSTVAPAHRNRAAEALDGAMLRALLRSTPPGATIVATMPWQWPAVSGARDCRRVLDVGDDWATLIPAAARRARDLYARAAEEADAIVVASETLCELFPTANAQVVRNAVDDCLLDPPLSSPPGARRLVYVGTLSERFDAPLVGEVLDLLADWTLDLHGPCAYARCGEGPSPELTTLIDRPDGRARWHGPAARERVASLLDRGDVLLLANRGAASRGQDSMKIYDYAARGRPVVATAASMSGISETPPHLRVGGRPDELARLVAESAGEPGHWRQDRAGWAAAQSWDSRWPGWARALFGAGSESEGEAA
jgi:glycosyltransferase involved in cell wall biosynthesis